MKTVWCVATYNPGHDVPFTEYVKGSNTPCSYRQCIAIPGRSDRAPAGRGLGRPCLRTLTYPR
ncbi:hypothetical protein ACWD4J_13525 [Streptomyces sp. NPDC002577]